MGALQPWHWIIIIAVFFLLFGGAAKLPNAARSLGQSMRIFKSEVKEMRSEGTPETPPAAAAPPTPIASERADTPAPAPAPHPEQAPDQPSNPRPA